MVGALARIALAQFLADEPGHHAAHPLLADDGVAGVVDGDVVLEVDALVGRGHGGLLGEEGGGLGGRHFGWEDSWEGQLTGSEGGGGPMFELGVGAGRLVRCMKS